MHCTECNGPLDVSTQAKSVSCEHCHQRVLVEDVKLTRYTAVTRYATCGRLEIGKKVRLVAEVRAGELVVKGSVTGDVVVTSRIEVHKHGRIEGALRARRLKLALGGVIEGPCRVGPDAVPEAPDTRTP